MMVRDLSHWIGSATQVAMVRFFYTKES
jgi:hypothetical protein